MAYLLDTHTIIWLISQPNRLGNTARQVIENPKSDLYYSPLSFSEIAIKASRGKITMADNWQVFYDEILFDRDINVLQQSWQDSVILQSLPFHHKDPFDRMLISLAMANNLAFISRDKQCTRYDLTVIWD